jgi:hypothetical protein
MRTLLPLDGLANCSDVALKQLGYGFHRNQTEKVIEFEVFEPAEFLVRIEDMSDTYRPGAFGGLIGGGEGGNSISIVYSRRDANERARVSAFVKALLEALPRKPWEGLGFIGSRTSKAYWHDLSENRL